LLRDREVVIQEFRQFLNIARRSLFEDASMLLVFESLGFFDSCEIDGLLTDCDLLSRKIMSFLEKSERLRARAKPASTAFALCSSPFALCFFSSS
jgi:hypothetical protein